MGKIEKIMLPYSNDSAMLFEKLQDLEWAVFLDSCASFSTLGRYDIISALPYIILTTTADRTEIKTEDQVSYSYEDPFTLLKQYLGSITSSPSSDHLPFAGGAIGYFAYDLARRIELLPTSSLRDIPFPEMAIGIYDWAIIVDHKDKSTWLINAGKNPKTSKIILDILDRIKNHTTITTKPFTLCSEITSNLSKENYAHAFHQVKRYIKNGDCYQVNLSQRFHASFNGCSWTAYKRLRQANPAPYAAYLNLPQHKVLSLSPERFLKVIDKQVETKPIKGTRPRDKSDPVHDQCLAQELLTSQKDRAENLMIVDLLRNDLSKNCKIGSVKVPKLFHIESFPAVHHLVTTVHGELLDDKHSIDLLRGCFPGGSITGAPKYRTMQIIEELEPHRRAIYCGSIGYISYTGNMDTNIAIRTLLNTNDAIYFSAGGGLVADSTLQDEYDETFAKVSLILSTLKMN